MGKIQTTPKHAVIIGSGPGGCALAVYLSQEGYQVDIFEKQNSFGGRCGQLQREGHRFDLGATLLLMPRLFKSIYADWGEKLDDHLKLRPLDPIYKFFFEKSGSLEFTPDLQRLKSQLDEHETGSFKKFEKYFQVGNLQYLDSMRNFLGRNFYSWLDYFNPANGFRFFRLKAHLNHYRFAKRFFKSRELLAAFTFQNIYVGQSPYNTSAIYTLLPAMELSYGGWYPEGGMHGVVQSLMRLAQKRGAHFYSNSPVEKILTLGSEAKGIRLEDGSKIQADVVISNADLPYVYRALLPDSLYAKRLGNLEYTCSAIEFHWGLDKAYPLLTHHNVFLAHDYRQGFDRIFKDQNFGEPPHFYINRPTHSEIAAAPLGHDSLSVIIPSGHLDPRHPQDWEILARTGKQAVLQRLKQIGLHDIEKHIKFEILFTPPVWERSLNLSRGSVFGSLSHGLLQIGYLRPSNQHPKYANLYFVGGSTHPGSGVPLALLSARLTAERIFRNQGVVPSTWGKLEF